MSLGAIVNIIQNKFNNNYITFDTDPFYDNITLNSNFSQSKFDIDLGLFIESSDTYMGLSTTHLNQAQLTLDGNTIFKNVRHYHVIAGYKYRLPSWTIHPSIVEKSDEKSTQIESQIEGTYNNKLIIGLGYRIKDAFCPFMGYQSDLGKVNIKSIYSYDIASSNLGNYSKGSHEIAIMICFKQKNLQNKTY